MDINPQSAKPISDDQELAKVLAGVSQQPDEPVEPVVAPPAPTPAPVVPATSSPYGTPAPVVPSEPAAAPSFAVPVPAPAGGNDLESIKKDALTELRPLVDKLDLDPEEKFDTYLLLLRSTDDKALIAPAHAAAQAITDEARKAQALLDIIKEIDYFSAPKQ